MPQPAIVKFDANWHQSWCYLTSLLLLNSAKTVDLRHKNQAIDAAKSVSCFLLFGHLKNAETKRCAMEDRMYGVVLWADAQDKKAVIWCEDHGNLAFYSGKDPSAHQGVSLDAGDLIQFEIREEPNYRRARNLKRVVSAYAPDLPKKLRRKVQEPSNVVQFPTAHAC